MEDHVKLVEDHIKKMENNIKELENKLKTSEAERNMWKQKFEEQIEMEAFRALTFNDLAGEKIKTMGDLVVAWKKIKNSNS